MCKQREDNYVETTFGECTDNEKKETVISDCSEIRTEGTSRPSVGMLSRLLRTETKDFESSAIRAHAALGSPPLTHGHGARPSRWATIRTETYWDPACSNCIVAIAKRQLRLIFGNVALDHAMAWLKNTEPRRFACYA